MGKPFKDTKVGQFLTGSIGKGIVKSIPFIGDVAGNILDENGAEPGKPDFKDMRVQLVKLGLLAVLLWLALSGKISFEDAERGKEFIGG